MKILAFDTSSNTCSVALLNTDNPADKQVHLLNKNLPMQQGLFILPLIKEILEQSGLTLAELDAIAYGCGPGSFTGIRIANSVAQGIGFAVKLPIIPVSSLAAIAQAAYMKTQSGIFLVAIDARMEQIYWAAYGVNMQNNCVELLGDEQVCKPEQIIVDQLDKQNDWCGVGDGWIKYDSHLKNKLEKNLRFVDSAQVPSAEAILTLAKIKFANGNWVSSAEAVPVYLR